ncbi:MAG: protein-L-isoaspartate(D-aspartate) O-methyltransferase [Bacteroidales bacterium]
MMIKGDTSLHKGMRHRLVKELIAKGIQSDSVLNAISKVPRHLFLDSAFVKYSYVDKPFSIGDGQTISQPYTVAFQSQLLDTKPGCRVLEIGTGSGYQAAVLLELGVRLYTMERIKNLYVKSRQTLNSIGYNPFFFWGDGYKGLPQIAPFDRILITAGAKEVPQELISQLVVGGKMVVPVGDNSSQEMLLIERHSETEYTQNRHGEFSFVPMLLGKK